MNKNWLITHNNPKFDAQDYIAKWAPLCNYVNGQLEKGEDGTVHIQAYISLKVNARISKLKKHDPHAHFEMVKRDNGASAYCLKTATRLEGPWEHGIRPMQRNSKTDWEAIYENAKKGDMDAIPADIKIRCYNQLKRIEKDHQLLPARTQPKDCLWYWGAPRTGKTRKARGDHPDAYIKAQTKWWDSYQGQKTVIIDDLGHEPAKFLVNYLKLWADPWYNQPGEDKGGQKALIYDTLIITANYHINDLDITQVDKDALLSRFKIHHFN